LGWLVGAECGGDDGELIGDAARLAGAGRQGRPVGARSGFAERMAFIRTDPASFPDPDFWLASTGAHLRVGRFK
jgi:hypothetical protein